MEIAGLLIVSGSITANVNQDFAFGISQGTHQIFTIYNSGTVGISGNLYVVGTTSTQ